MDAVLETAYLNTLRRISQLAWADDFFSTPAPVGPQLDGLAAPAPWSPLRWALFQALGAIEPRQKLAAVSMASNEAPYLAEWIAHHLAIGVEKIFIYTNNNSDGTDEVLRWFAANAPVVVIPVASRRGVNVQQKNYRHALALLPELRLFEWVALLDMDEFLLPDAGYGHHLPALLAAAPADTEAILIPWHWRLWERDFERGPGLLAERFGHAIAERTVKSVMRLRHTVSLHQVHFPEFDQPRVMRDSAFNEIHTGHNWHQEYRPGSGAWVEHFWGKSFVEFVVKKRRGEALEVADPEFHRQYEDFFTWGPNPAPELASPWPAAMLAATKARLAGFAAMPGWAEVQGLVETRFAAHAASLRGDAALCALYDEMKIRFAK